MAQIRSDVMIALGANMPSEVGSPKVTLRKALSVLESESVTIRGVSRFFHTPCFPAGAGPDYVNAAVRIETMLDARQLLAVLHDIEASFGRLRDQRWGQRTLDMDLVAFGGQIAPDVATYRQWHQLDVETQKMKAPDQLILPHPRLQDRAFVLIPLADVAPDWRHPVLGHTVQEMLNALPQDVRDEVKPL